MDKASFFKIYIPVLEKSLQNDHKNYGFYVKSPEDYLCDSLAREIGEYLENNEDFFTEKVGYYFDAKSHNFSKVQGVDINILIVRNH